MRVEQAIFTSAQTARAEGYHLVAASPDISDADRQALATWGPSHDSLLATGAGAVSVNFFRLPSGDYCTSKTVAAGTEYSGRGGCRVDTHCLVTSPKALRQFSNNPFALLRAAVAGGHLCMRQEIVDDLDPLHLVGGAAVLNRQIVARFARDPGPGRLAELIHRVLRSERLGIPLDLDPPTLIAGLITCLPLAMRTEVSFSTGLKESLRRPFRVIAVSGDPAQQRRLVRHHSVTILDAQEQEEPRRGWPGFVSAALRGGLAATLADDLSSPDAPHSAEALDARGDRLLDLLAG